MTLGEINRGAVALVLVLLLGAGGYLWFNMMYKPAVAAQKQATEQASAAEAQLATAKQQLAEAQQKVEDSKKEASKVDDSVARLAKARTAIPDQKLIDDAAIVLVEEAQRSGIQTSFKAGDESGGDSGSFDASSGGGGLQGAKPIDLEFEAAGTYSEMMHFMQLVESTAEVEDGKLYTRGRLFNVVKLEIGKQEKDSSSQGGFGGASESSSAESEFDLGPNDILFTVTVRMYTSSTDNAESVGETTPDPAAAATTTTDPNAAGATGAATTDPNAAGATGAATTDPNAAGATGSATDPAGAGASTSADPAAGAASVTTPTSAGGI
jgi:hypothetical protein